jgi:hypothetical protein
MNPDDWVCAACQNVNYARRDKCNRCQLAKPAGLGPPSNSGAGGSGSGKPKYPAGVLSKEDIAKSNGRHAPGDWACGKCFVRPCIN